MPRAPGLLTDNWHLKLAALGLSVFLWALVQNEPLSQETFSAVPVAVSITDTTWTLSGAPTPAMVELRLGGPAREIIRLARDGTQLIIPVTAVGSRDTTVTLQREWVQIGTRAGVTVETISPPVIGLRFEHAASKSLPVALRTRGELPAELALSTALVVSPDRATLRGPESLLSGLESLRSEPFDLTQVRESGVFTIAVDTSGLGAAAVDPPEVVVGVRVEDLEERTLSAIPVVAETAPGQPVVVVEPPTVQLRLAGARTVVRAMDLSLLQVSVAPESLRDILPNEARRVRLQVEGLPPLVTASPSTETVIVRLAPEES